MEMRTTLKLIVNDSVRKITISGKPQILDSLVETWGEAGSSVQILPPVWGSWFFRQCPSTWLTLRTCLHGQTPLKFLIFLWTSSADYAMVILYVRDNSIKFKMGNYCSKLRRVGCRDVAVNQGKRKGQSPKRSIKRPFFYPISLRPVWSPNLRNLQRRWRNVIPLILW